MNTENPEDLPLNEYITYCMEKAYRDMRFSLTMKTHVEDPFKPGEYYIDESMEDRNANLAVKHREAMNYLQRVVQ